MSVPWKLAVLAVLCLGFLLLLRPTAQPTSFSDATAAVGLTAPKAKVKTAPPPPAPTASKEPISLQSRLRERLLEPPEWRPPTLRMVLNTTSPSRRDAPLRTAIPGGTDADLEAPAGDYATLQPQQLGQAYQPDARLQGSMYTLLRNGYSLSLQQQQNVALVPISFDLPRGEFALHAESAGHYVIALHLSNPQATSYGFHNKLQRLEFEQHVIPVITTLVQQDETIQSGATFVVPCLIQLDAGEWVSFYWYLQGGNVLFHALTVDKVG